MIFGTPKDGDKKQSLGSEKPALVSFDEKVEQYQEDDIAQQSFQVSPIPKEYPDEFFRIIFFISSKEFSIDVKSILQLRNEKGNFEVRDGINALERISGMRQIIISAMQDTYNSLQSAKDAFDVWEAENKAWAEDEVTKKRIIDIEARRRKEIGQITNDQKMSAILAVPSKKADYLAMKDEITKLQSLYDTLDRTCDNLFNRGIHLLKILNLEGQSEGYQIK